jgi:hypothetical protein
VNVRGSMWLGRHPSALLGLSALFLSVGSGLILQNPSAGAPLLLAAGAVGGYGSLLRDRSQTDSEAAAESLRLSEHRVVQFSGALGEIHDRLAEAVEAWTQAIYVWAELNSDSRLTLYSLSESGWMRMARYSLNLEYMNSGRRILPIDQGIVHWAHLRGEHFIDSLPPADASDAYYDEQKRLNVTKRVSREFVMKSRSYACFGFGRKSERTRPYMLVFESVDPNGLDTDALQRLLHSDAQSAVAELLLGLHKAEQARLFGSL